MILTKAEKLARRRERLRLIAYLKRGGRLVREDLPAGAVAWCPASRSGPPFHDRAVSRLRKKGAVVRGEKWIVFETEEGHLRFFNEGKKWDGYSSP